jgi:3-phenylpropionate/trans-cinnamate dioxygenase ferredoxin reductase subunit
MQQGMHAAANMLGADRDYDVVPYFFSDLADWASLEYVGPAADWEQEIWRGSRADGEFSVWYLKGGKVAGCLSLGRSEDLAEARRMIHEGVDISGATDRIADATANLSSL